MGTANVAGFSGSHDISLITRMRARTDRGEHTVRHFQRTRCTCKTVVRGQTQELHARDVDKYSPTHRSFLHPPPNPSPNRTRSHVLKCFRLTSRKKILDLLKMSPKGREYETKGQIKTMCCRDFFPRHFDVDKTANVCVQKQAQALLTC